MATYNFSLPGIRCVNCVKTVERTLRGCGLNLIDIDVQVVPKTLSVNVVDQDKEAEEIKRIIINALDEVGEECIFIPENPIEIPLIFEVRPEETQEALGNRNKSWVRSHRFLGLLGTSSGLVWVLISLLGISLSMPIMMTMAITSIALTLFLGADSYREAYIKWVKTRTLTMDSLFAISTLTIITVSIAGFFLPWMPMMCDAGLLIFGFRHIGIAIEESFKNNMGLNVTFKDRLPPEVSIFGSSEKKNLAAVLPGEIIVVEPGELIPLDGDCQSRGCLVYAPIKTGSVLPVGIEAGEEVISGMYVAEDSPPIRIKVTRNLQESNLAKMDKDIAKANKEKAPIETVTDKILQYFIPTVLAIALTSTALVTSFFSLALGLQCGVSILVFACPCTLGFIIPLAILIGMNKAGENGVQFKSAKYLQEAESIQKVAFDLRGTFTKGIFSVRKFEVLPNTELSAKEFLTILKAIEKNSSHPIARDICKFVDAENTELMTEDLVVTNIDKSHRSGIKGTIEEHDYLVGNRKMMRENGVDTQSIDELVIMQDDEHLVYLARDKQVIGYMLLNDPLRENAKFAVDSLKDMGMEVYIITGEDEATARRIGNLLGIKPEFIRGGYLPGQKSEEIGKLREDGSRVAMVGDNSNDAVAIAAADFGIAVRGVDKVTEEQAGALIYSGCLLPVVNAFSVAKQTVSNIRQNLWISLGYNLGALMLTCGLLLTAGIVLNPAVGVATMFLQSMLVLSNAYRFKQQELSYAPNFEQERSTREKPSRSYQIVNDCLPCWQVDLSAKRDLEEPLIHHPKRKPSAAELVSENTVTCVI